MRVLLPLATMGPILVCAVAQAAPAVSNISGNTRPDHPSAVSLMEEAQGYLYRQFGTGLRLYISDRDPPGRSVCNLGCSTQWIPVVAPDDARPIGDWSIVIRDGGRKQWALKGKPVYTRIHDIPDAPTGDGHQGTWHVLKPMHITGDIATHTR